MTMPRRTSGPRALAATGLISVGLLLVTFAMPGAGAARVTELKAPFSGASVARTFSVGNYSIGCTRDVQTVGGYWNSTQGHWGFADGGVATICRNAQGGNYSESFASPTATLQVALPVPVAKNGPQRVVADWSVVGTQVQNYTVVKCTPNPKATVFTCASSTEIQALMTVGLRDATTGAYYAGSLRLGTSSYRDWWFQSLNVTNVEHTANGWANSTVGASNSLPFGVLPFTISATLNATHRYVLVSALEVEVFAYVLVYQATMHGFASASFNVGTGSNHVTLRSVTVA